MEARTTALAAAMTRAPPGYLTIERIAELSGLSVPDARAELEHWAQEQAPPNELSVTAQTVKAVLDSAPAGQMTVDEIGGSLRATLARRGLEELARAGYVKDDRTE